MGKHFRGYDANQEIAIKKANTAASNYRRARCVSPAKPSTCTFEPAQGIWNCLARAHHERGSCRGGFGGRHGNSIGYPPIGRPDPGGFMKGLSFDLSDSFDLTDEEYTEATPEEHDYTGYEDFDSEIFEDN